LAVCRPRGLHSQGHRDNLQSQRIASYEQYQVFCSVVHKSQLQLMRFHVGVDDVLVTVANGFSTRTCFLTGRIQVQCSPANPAQAGEEAVGLADLSGLPSSFCVLVGE